MSAEAAAAKDEAPRLSDDQLREVLELSRGADTFELKLTVPEEDRFATLTSLGVDPLDAYIRQVYFFDTPQLTLDEAGVVVRARRSQGRPDDSVVKLRPIDPADLDDELRASEGFGVEVDAMPGGYVCSASFKAKLDKPVVKQVAAGEEPVRKAFTKHQRGFYADRAPEGLGLDDLSILGPVGVFKLKLPVDEIGRKLTIELWNYPDGTRILELSTKCLPDEAFQVAAEARAYLVERGISLSGAQTTKTRTALEYFASNPLG